jgi:hypothetical protein
VIHPSFSQQIHNEANKQVLLAGITGGREQCQSHQGFVVKAMFTKQAVDLQKIKKKKGANPFVAIGEGMILDHEIQKMSRFFLHT